MAGAARPLVETRSGSADDAIRPHKIRLALLVAGLSAILAAAPRAQTDAPLRRFEVLSDAHPLTVWSRVPASPRAAVLFVHGRTWSSRPDFDLQTVGVRRSVMSAFARRDIAAYAVDLRGYGSTPRDSTGWNTPRQSMRDVTRVLAWISSRHSGLPRPALVGWSRGAAIAMLSAQAGPSNISSLILFGFAPDPGTKFSNPSPPARPQRRRNTAESAAADFISPAITPKEVIDGFVAQALAADPVSVDVGRDDEFNLLDPTRVMSPTLVIYGSRDSGVEAAAASRFFDRLATREKQLVVIPGADHAAHLEDTHDQWVDAVAGFVMRHAAPR